MKLYFLLCLIFLFSAEILYAETSNVQAIYVDCSTGDDNNKGTAGSPIRSINKAIEIIKSKDNDIYKVKINPGIHTLDNAVSVSTEKDMIGKRIVIEASTLPDDPSWTPEQMPVIVNLSKRNPQRIVSFLIDESHVTIRGLKFTGYFYPNSYYFPIARMNKAKTDLLVEQCMFNGDKQSFVIQVAVIGHGDGIKIDHCVFYKVNNAAVFWMQNEKESIKTGNSFTNSIVIGASQTAIWTSWPDKDFAFKNNIVSDCKHAWIKNHFNNTKYSIENCVIANNQNYQGVWHEEGVIPEEFEVIEKNVIKEGKISLRFTDNIDNPMPTDFLHILPDSLGYNIGAGLFKSR